MPQPPKPPDHPHPLHEEPRGADAPAVQHQNEVLDEALDESFPASDSIAVNITRVMPDEEADPKPS